MDYALFKIINDLALRWPAADWLGIFCADYLIFLLGIFIIIWGFLKKNKKERAAHWFMSLEIIVAAIFGYLVKVVINLVYLRPRPFLTHDVHQLVGGLTDGSFPSMHTIVSFAMAFGIYLYNKKFGIIFIFLAGLVSLSRIFVGVHYPTDILGGVILAWLMVHLAAMVHWKKIFKIKS